jgi:GntR family transcriptional regulator/MocR family aminotransferase
VQFLGRDKIYALENPSYEKIHSVYKANGAMCELLKLGKDGILTSQLNKSKASVLHITPFQSFPSGVTASASKRNEYIKWATDRGAVIIEDDFNSEFTVSTKNEDTVFSLEPTESVIYVNTFTKTIAPSMRIGYMVLPEKLTEAFFDKMGFYSCTVPVFEQYVLAEIIANGDFERHINRTRRKMRQIDK